MSVLQYLKPTARDGLPDPKGSLSQIMPLWAISLANSEVHKASYPQSQKSFQKVLNNLIIIYSVLNSSWFIFVLFRYNDKNLLCTAKYTGETRAGKYFSRNLAMKISKATVLSIRKSYLLEIKRKRWRDADDDLISLPHKKWGKCPLLGEMIDNHVLPFKSLWWWSYYSCY